jgi:hypothetical protein
MMLRKPEIPPTFPPPFDDFVADLKAVGLRRTDTGGEGFSVVTARSNLRWWLIPLDHGRACAQAGYEMFQPVTWTARMAKWGLQTWARLRPTGRAWGREMRLSGTPGFLATIGETAVCCSYFTGTDGPHRKTAAQIMTRSGEIVGYAKITRNPKVIPYLENEARMLELVAELELASAAVPTLLDYTHQNGVAQLVTDSLRHPGHVVTRRLGPAHRKFLGELAAKTSWTGGANTLSGLAHRLDEIGPALSTEWSSRLDAGIAQVTPSIDALRVGLAHGDFTPWNTFLVGERLYVFDWEYAQPAYPLGYDAVHFTLATHPAAHVPDLLDGLVADIAAEWYGGDHATAARSILFSLLLHSAFYLGRALVAGHSEQTWVEAEAWAQAIDNLLVRVNS